MKTSPAPKPTLAILGKRDLELGPFAIDEAPQEPGPWANWRLRTDEDGIAWLLFDKKDASANTLSEDVLIELNAVLEKIERDHPRGLVIRSAKRQRLHRRRRHRPVPRRHRSGADRGGADARPRGARSPRPAAAADCRGRSTAIASAAGSKWRWPAISASPSMTRASAFPKCCSACIPASAARCG